MTALVLATYGGRQLTPVWTGQRYAAEANGAIRDHNQGRTLPLIEADELLRRLTADAARALGTPLHRVLAPEAVSLERAIKTARQPAEPRREFAAAAALIGAGFWFLQQVGAI